MFLKNIALEGYKSINLKISNQCIHCHTIIEPIHLLTTKVDNIKKTFALIMQCPSCKKYLLFPYQKDWDEAYLLTYDYNNIPLDMYIPDQIIEKFPKFVEIYEQSLKAEAFGLNDISGVGYRKALEFLIKDFVINILEYNSDEISSLTLANTIRKIENPQINNLATATTWIGNDQTHYERRYEDKDIQDMKMFLKALINFISYELTLKEALGFIEENKKN